MDIINFFLGLAVGLATNLFSWWLMFHGIVPKMRFSDVISKYPTSTISNDKSKLRYIVKFENSGRRSIIDLEVMARLSIDGLEPDKDKTHVFLIPLNPDGNLSFRWAESLPRGKTKKSQHISRFYINSAVEHLDRPPFPDNIRRKARLGKLTLEDLLSLGSKADLVVQAFGYDKFSGARKLFTSKKYTVLDIRYGLFEKSSLNIDPQEVKSSIKNKST